MYSRSECRPTCLGVLINAAAAAAHVALFRELGAVGFLKTLSTPINRCEEFRRYNDALIHLRFTWDGLRDT